MTARSFLKNSWYAAGWSTEIDDGVLLGRRLLGEPILLYRGASGAAVAIGDRCPHRFAPLHKGRLEAGQIRCGYHGLGFDEAGRCVHNPHGDDKAVRALSVPSYPVAESQGVLWIWMGEASRADMSLVPRFACLDETQFFTGRGYIRGEAHYELMVDNILDLSHVEFLHPGLGTPKVSLARVEVKQCDDRIVATRKMESEHLPPNLAAVYRTEGRPVDRTMEVEWYAPSNLLLSVRIDHAKDAEFTETGSQSLHLFTPETERSAHYFFVGAIKRSNLDRELFDKFFGALSNAFLSEDKPMIDAQQAMLGPDDIMDLRPALLPIDKAAVLARRRVARLIDDEAR